MSKLNTGKASVLALTAVAVLASFLLGKSLTSVSADTDNTWSTPTEQGWGACTPKNDCGSEGTQTQTLTCIHKDEADENCKTHNYSYVYADKNVTPAHWGDWEDGHNHGNGIESRHKNTHDSDWDYEICGQSCHEEQHRHWISETSACPTDYSHSGYDSSWPKECRKQVDSGPDTKVISRDCILTDYRSCEVQCPENATPNSDNNCECNSGYHSADATNLTCVIDESTPAPVPTPLNCTGDQHPDGGGVNCVSFSQAGPPPEGPYTPQGQVLGASTGGQVLGASTMAGTGSFAEIFYQAIMGIGATISAFGIKGLKKSKKAI